VTNANHPFAIFRYSDVSKDELVNFIMLFILTKGELVAFAMYSKESSVYLAIRGLFDMVVHEYQIYFS
jgi:hypothetical protein